MAQKEDEASEDERRYTAAAKGKGKAMEVDDEDEPTTTAASLQLQALTSRLTRVAQLGGRIGSQLSKRSAESPAVVEPSKRAKQDRESNGTVKVMATLSGVIVPAKDGGEASFERHLAIEYEAEEATMDSTTEDLQLSVSAEHPVDVRRGVPRADVVPVFVEQGGSELGEEVLQLEANVVAGTLTDPAADARRQKEINEVRFLRSLSLEVVADRCARLNSTSRSRRGRRRTSATSLGRASTASLTRTCRTTSSSRIRSISRSTSTFIRTTDLTWTRRIRRCFSRNGSSR